MSARQFVPPRFLNELAAVFVWLSLFIPWNVVHIRLGDLGQTTFFRFLPVQIQQVSSTEGATKFAFQSFHDFLTMDVTAATIGLHLWFLAALAMVAAVVTTVGLHFREEEMVEELRVYPAVFIGLLLLTIGGLLAVAEWFLSSHGLPGLRLPIGVPLYFVFGAILLVNPRPTSSE